MGMKINKEYFEVAEFRDGAVLLNCGNMGAATDLVFAEGCMRPDPALEDQRKLLEYIVRAVQAYEGE